jgi:hypothetical protein
MKKEVNYGIDDIDLLVKNKHLFEDFVYTPVNEAIEELNRRRQNVELGEKVSNLLDDDVPESLQNGLPRAVIFRQITTPNYEIRRFIHLIEAIEELTPLFGEYQDDKFTSNNDYKHSWGKMLFHKKHGEEFDSLKIIDLVKADGKKISSIETHWGQSLIDFHHELIEKTYISVNKDFFLNISPWLKAHGGCAKNYYVQVLLWFVRHAILFENFMLNESKEAAFTREIFLPAFMEICKLVGHKPLIVNLLPTSIEHEKFWLSHPIETKAFVEAKLNKLVV